MGVDLVLSLSQFSSKNSTIRFLKSGRVANYIPRLIEFGIFELITVLILNHIDQYLQRIFLLVSQIPQIFHSILLVTSFFFEDFHNLSMRFRFGEYGGKKNNSIPYNPT